MLLPPQAAPLLSGELRGGVQAGLNISVTRYQVLLVANNRVFPSHCTDINREV